MAKYDNLRAHFLALREMTWAPKLADIEEILGSKLPGSALKHRTWWANSGGNLVHQNAWLEAGWRVDAVDLARSVVTFRRMRIGGLVARPQANGSATRKSDTSRTAAAKTAPVQAELGGAVTITLRAQWTSVGKLAQLSAEADWVNDEGAVLRMVSVTRSDQASVLIDCNRLSQAVGMLRDPCKRGAEPGLAAILDGPDGSQTEIHVLRPGNAWLLADGQGRKADLTVEDERHMVAQLLFLQECQSGRGQKLLSL